MADMQGGFLRDIPTGALITAGSLTVTTGTDPAAGTEFEVEVPAGESWLLVSVSVALAQGATQTPQPVLVIDDGATTVFESFGSSAAQAASTTCRYTWAPGLPLTAQVGSSTNVHSTAPLPCGLVLGAGWRVSSSTLGIGANSNYGAPAVAYVRLRDRL